MEHVPAGGKENPVYISKLSNNYPSWQNYYLSRANEGPYTSTISWRNVGQVKVQRDGMEAKSLYSLVPTSQLPRKKKVKNKNTVQVVLNIHNSNFHLPLFLTVSQRELLKVYPLFNIEGNFPTPPTLLIPSEKF